MLIVTSRRNLLNGDDLLGVWSCKACRDTNMIMLGLVNDDMYDIRDGKDNCSQQLAKPTCQQNIEYEYFIFVSAFILGIIASHLWTKLIKIASRFKRNAIIASVFKLEKKMIYFLKKNNYDQVITILNSQLPNIIRDNAATPFQIACLKHLLAKA
jgi:hypothetical protein